MPTGGNLLEVFTHAAASRFDTPFLLEPDGSTTTYGEIFAQAAGIALVLREHRVEAGDRVVVQVEKTGTAVALYLGCLHAGAVHVPLNPGFTADELRYFVHDTEPSVLVVEDAAIPPSFPDVPTIGVDDLDRASRPGGSDDPPASRTGDDLAALLYTSGTTGRPKGAALTHENLRHNAEALHRVWQFSASDHLLHALPIFHVHGLFVALHCALLSAIPVTFLPRFDVDAVLDALPKTTVFMGVPTHYGRLLADPRLDAELTEGARLFTSGSAPLPGAVFDAFTARTGHLICERYGMSEAGIITSNPVDGTRRAGTVGFPLPGVQVRIHTDDGEQAPIGQTGSVEVRGPHLFHGYWRQPEATAAALRADGWFVTGDMGHIDDDGRLTLQGRTSDMIITGGENVYPKEIELVLETVPGVIESAVIGLPHPDFGEAVTAVVVVDGDDRLGAIPVALTGALARFKHPKATITVDTLPRNAMGKVQKDLLRERFADHYSGGG